MHIFDLPFCFVFFILKFLDLKEKRYREREREKKRMLKGLNRFIFQNVYKVAAVIGVGSFVFTYYESFKMIIKSSFNVNDEEIAKGR